MPERLILKGMPKRLDFSQADKIKMLLWCARHCCLCGKNAGPDIEIAHIGSRRDNDIDNGIPLCYDCHAKIGHYNLEHPKGNKYKPEELKARREQVYEEHTTHLIPPIHFWLDQTKADGKSSHILPFVGFRIQHYGATLPARLRVEAKVLLGGRDLGLVNDPSGYYTGATIWNINPHIFFWGGFSISQEQFARSATEELKIEVRMTLLDQFERSHRLLPQCYRWVREGNFWNLEPRSFAIWN